MGSHSNVGLMHSIYPRPIHNLEAHSEKVPFLFNLTRILSLFIFMPRRYVKRTRVARDKYSIEQTNFQSPQVSEWTTIESTDEAIADSKQWVVPLINPASIQGMRKVKHLTVTLANTASDANLLFYSIVYVPEGYEAQPLQFPAPDHAISNYKANQFVMSSGAVDFSAGPTRIRTPLSRNLNSGDNILMILATNTGASANLQIIGQITYAITLQ